MQDPIELTGTTGPNGQEQAGELSAEDLGNISGGADSLRLLAEVSVLQAQSNTGKTAAD